MKPKVKQFEIWTASLDPSVGIEPGKTRPVVIVQSDVLHNAGHDSTIVCAISSQQREGFSIIRLPLQPNAENGLKKQSYILVDQIRALDLVRLKERVGYLEPESIRNLKNSIHAILAL